jgi:hypothetical protein
VAVSDASPTKDQVFELSEPSVNNPMPLSTIILLSMSISASSHAQNKRDIIESKRIVYFFILISY